MPPVILKASRSKENDMNGDQDQPIGAQIRHLIASLKSLKDDPAVDKKWLNKVIARQEEVEVFTSRLYKSDSLGNPSNLASLDATNGCTCPPGVIDTVDCPLHKK